MKQYIIAVYDESLIETMHVDRGNRPTNGTGVAYAHHTSESNSTYDYSAFNATCRLYFADTMADAEVVANKIASKAPGKSVVVGKSCDVFSAPPGQVKRQKISDKGLLPA